MAYRTGLISYAAGSVVVTATAAPSTLEWLLPLIVGCLAALIVRAIVISQPSKRKRVWIFELLVTLLSVLLTGVLVYERHLTLMYATFTGMSMGAMGVSVIAFARNWGISLVKSLLGGIQDALDKKPPS